MGAFSGPALAAPQADEPAGPRLIHVGAGSALGDGSTVDLPLASISAALKISRPGDTIVIAPGEYREHIRVSTPGLSFIGQVSGENEPLVRVTGKSSAPLLADSHNSLWRGVGFYARGGAAAELNGFTGRFEHCLFQLEGLFATINISGGKPVFQACSFLGHPGPAAAININEPGESAATFAYCLFRDLKGGAVLLRGAQDINFSNCLFVNYQFIAMRHENVDSAINFVNSVFYLGSSPKLFLQKPSAPKVALENCLYAPGPGDYLLWQARPLREQPELDCLNCKAASPRFEKGRRVLLNFCIDDTVHAPVWSRLLSLAEKLGLKITLALDTGALNRDYWNVIIPRAKRGFELASHGAVHASLIAEDAIKLAWHAPGMSSASLVIDRDKNFAVFVDGTETFSLSLAADPRPNLGDLVKLLQEAGFRAELTDLSFGKIPAAYLASVEGRDIGFEFHEPTLILDAKAYTRFMLAESRAAIEGGLKEYAGLQSVVEALVCPFAETGPHVAEAMDDTGYTVSRGRSEKNLASALDQVNLYFINGVSLKNILPANPADSQEEMFRLYFDFLKYHGAIMGLYSHGFNEFSLKDWTELFDVVSGDPLIKTVSLTEMQREVREGCEEIGPGLYRCPEDSGPVRGEVSFRPGTGSPLLRAGKNTPFATNFMGEPVPKDGPPNIGIY